MSISVHLLENLSDPFLYSLITVNNEQYENEHGEEERWLKCFLKGMGYGAREMAQQLRAWTILKKQLGLFHSTHVNKLLVVIEEKYLLFPQAIFRNQESKKNSLSAGCLCRVKVGNVVLHGSRLDYVLPLEKRRRTVLCTLFICYFWSRGITQQLLEDGIRREEEDGEC